jgi:hypothetical protein
VFLTLLQFCFIPLLQFCFYHSFSSVSTTASVLFNHYLAFVPNYHTLRDRCPSTAASNLARRWGLSPTDQPRKDPFDSPFTSVSTISMQGPPLYSLSVPNTTFIPFLPLLLHPFPSLLHSRFQCSFTSVSTISSPLFPTNFFPFHHSFGSFRYLFSSVTAKM